jgi:hypothetical protein
MDYKTAFHKEYLSQQGLEPTQENIKQYSVDPNQLKLIHESPRYWIVLNDGGPNGQWLDVIWKEVGYYPKREMKTIPL